jgi:hypothetical protein
MKKKKQEREREREEGRTPRQKYFFIFYFLKIESFKMGKLGNSMESCGSRQKSSWTRGIWVFVCVFPFY